MFKFVLLLILRPMQGSHCWLNQCSHQTTNWLATRDLHKCQVCKLVCIIITAKMATSQGSNNWLHQKQLYQEIKLKCLKKNLLLGFIAFLYLILITLSCGLRPYFQGERVGFKRKLYHEYFMAWLYSEYSMAWFYPEYFMAWLYPEYFMA